MGKKTCNTLGLILAFLIATPRPVLARLFPAEGSKLHYRIVGFVFGPVKNGGSYTLEIALGNYNDAAAFKKHTIVSLKADAGKAIAEVPYFGSDYTWRVSAAGKNVANGELHHFSTKTSPNADTSTTRLRITQHGSQYNNAYVLLDGNKAMYDMRGRPVWFLPWVDSEANENSLVRDMKVTPQGTITFIVRDDAYEIDYDGTLLWKAPRTITRHGTPEGGYHHEFTRLQNGHYMVLGTETADVAIGHAGKDSSLLLKNPDDRKRDTTSIIYRDAPFGEIVEYDEQGNEVWHYKTTKYLAGSDLLYHRDAMGAVNFRVHDNGFFFDEKTSTILISFKDISRIIKIKYPEGNLLDTYGEIYKPGVPEKGNGLFCYQHCCKTNAAGDVYMFNNNSCNPMGWPSIVVLGRQGGVALQKIWEYTCQPDDGDIGGKYIFGIGGSVSELPDGAIFASMAGNYSKLFIVTRGKEILWSAMAEKWNPEKKKWAMNMQYRASIIANYNELQHIILNSGKKSSP